MGKIFISTHARVRGTFSIIKLRVKYPNFVEQSFKRNFRFKVTSKVDKIYINRENKRVETNYELTRYPTTKCE